MISIGRLLINFPDIVEPSSLGGLRLRFCPPLCYSKDILQDVYSTPVWRNKNMDVGFQFWNLLNNGIHFFRIRQSAYNKNWYLKSFTYASNFEIFLALFYSTIPSTVYQYFWRYKFERINFLVFIYLNFFIINISFQ